jgi:hypothetical protein
MSKQRSWFIRLYQDGDEEQIFELRRAIHPERQYDKEPWLRWWNWMYKENPAVSRIWLAEDQGKIIGQYPLVLTNLKFGNITVKASQNINLEVHPDYRRQGIFLSLEKKALENLAKEAINITFGFPNDASYPGHIESGWLDIADTRKVWKPLGWENILKTRINNKCLLNLCTIFTSMLSKLMWRASEVPVVKGLLITKVSSFDDRINEFWIRVSSQFRIIGIRNKDYLNWRYATVPDVKYSIYIAENDSRIYGYLVLRYLQRNFAKVAVIYDLLAETEEVVQCLLHTASEHCQKNGMDYIVWSGIANRAYLRAFRKRGFIHVPFQKGQKFLAYSSDPKVSKGFLMNPQNWIIQIGDSDEL